MSEIVKVKQEVLESKKKKEKEPEIVVVSPEQVKTESTPN